MPKGNPYAYQGTQQAQGFGKGMGKDPGSKTSDPQTPNRGGSKMRKSGGSSHNSRISGGY